MEGGALAGLRFDPDLPVVTVHDLLADRQADAGSRILPAVVQSLEDQEDAILVLGSMPMPLSRTENCQ